jgi:transposase
LVRNQTQLSKAIRGSAAEFGLPAATGSDHLRRMLDRLNAADDLPYMARDLVAAQATEYAELQAKIAEIDVNLAAWQKSEPRCQRLMKIPGIAEIGAALLLMSTHPTGPALPVR